MFKKIIFIFMLFLFLKVHLQAEELRLKCTNFKGYSIEYDNGKKHELNMRSDFDANGIIRIIQRE